MKKTKLADLLFIKFIFINFYYQIERFVIDVANKYDKKGKKLLDVGAGASPYRKYFKNVKYVTQDITQNNKKTIDYVGDLNKGLPMIKNSSFDYILCTQVLEHLTNPHKAFAEFKRILKSKGKVFLTTNFI
jgi:ubiquinone/menaquinone biosynthesis C-methylase UbiE